jgi:hypothetical protein
MREKTREEGKEREKEKERSLRENTEMGGMKERTSLAHC